MRRPAPDAEQLSDLPQRGGRTDDALSLPRRGGPADDAQPLPSRLGPSGDALPLPRRGGPADDAQPLPSRLGPSGGAQPLPSRLGPSDDALPLPRRGGPADDSQPLPRRGNPTDDAQPLPSRLGPTGGAQPLPSRLGPTDDGQPLPRRTRSRPPGRHRSPHRLSVAADAPALVIAVPGSAEADTAGIGPAVAATAELSCPGVDIRIGYLEGDEAALSDCLSLDDEEAEADQFPSVVVPLLLSPSLRLDPAIRRLTGDSPIPAVLAAHLGPHPLVAEALHSRLAEAGLVRHSRASGLSISADGRGIVVLADIGEEATSAAAVAAVLLASRLSVPVVPASLGDPASIVTAVDRLTESGAGRPALAPCLIGPETSISVLDDLSAALGAPCAPAIGAHQAIGQLVAIRYGAALAGLSLAG
jgi:hypothetical protein